MSATTTRKEGIQTNDPAAHAVLRAAHEGGYRFPAGFTGFAARVSATEAATGLPNARLDGSVEVRDPRSITVTGDGPEPLRGWVSKELASMAGHRWPAGYEQGDGRWTLSIQREADGLIGDLITVHDDPFKSFYRVRDGRIAQVIRSMGGVSFTIAMQSHLATPDGRLLPATFSVAFWDTATGRLTGADFYTDEYAGIDGIMLPATRRVSSATDTGVVVRELRLTEWRLLSATGSASGR